jgi:hypothetical protein
MDFANYTLGRLVPKRRNYDFNNPEYKKVRGQIVWRISELGYSLERFRNVDQEIARSGHYRGRADNAERIERYGKKYAWIAFYELAGIRSVKRMLKRPDSDRPRLSDVDIEPSFATSSRVLRPAFIPTMALPPLDPPHVWLQDGGVPDLKPLLIRSDVLYGTDAVILDGFLAEECGPLHPRTWIQSFIVARNEADRIVTAAEKGELDDTLPQALGDPYVFAGEYPWLPELEPNGYDEIEVPRPPVKRKRVDKTTTWFRDGKEVAFPDIHQLLLGDAGGVLPGDGKKAWLAYLAAQMEKHKITSKTSKRTIEEDWRENETLKALRTVRDYSWEGYHTTTAASRNFSTLAPEIARGLGLHARPDEWELFQSDGTQVTRNLVYGEQYATEGALVYARRSAIQKYLNAEGKVLVIVVTGERILGGGDRAAHDAYELSGGPGTWTRAWRLLEPSTVEAKAGKLATRSSARRHRNKR